MIQGQPRSLILVNRKRVCHFLLVINSNPGPVLKSYKAVSIYIQGDIADSLKTGLAGQS